MGEEDSGTSVISQPMPLRGGMLERGIHITGIGIIGLWLVLLYPLLTWLVIGTLSGYGFQDKVEHVGRPSGRTVTLPDVMRFEEKLADLDSRESELLSKSRNAREEYLAYERAAGKVRDELVELLRKSRVEITVAGPHDFNDDDFLGNYVTTFTSLADEPYAVQTVNELWGRYQTERRAFERRNSEFTHLEGALEETRSSIEALLQDNPGEADMVSELAFLRNFGYKPLATMPSQLLTLLLTLSMGALGSLIYITHDYFSPTSHNAFSWYLFRPLLGMVTAIAVFVLAKAGQLTISDASITESAAENLNPYFISFLAIISGLLSEQATERIRAAGSSVFRVDRQAGLAPDRWAVGLKTHMEEQGKTAAELAPFVGEDEAVVQQWCEEQHPVPAKAQAIVAGWLGVPQRKLFTDLAPSIESKTPEHEPGGVQG